MTDTEILQKAIERVYPFLRDKEIKRAADDWLKSVRAFGHYTLNGFLFSHDFAKAFWGEEIENYGESDGVAWKINLQVMVLEENPIKYLEKFI